MEEFYKIEIQHICSNVCSGGTPKSTVPEYYGGNIPWLNTKEINFSSIYETEKTITEEGLNNSSAKWIPANSVIVAMYGATAGKTAITKIPLTTNQACCNLTIDSNMADYRFVYYALYNDYAYLASLANGGAQQNLNAQQIKEFEIPFPSLEEQKRIADILSSLDSKIALNCRINDNLEQQAQSLFKSWFVDFEPFRGGKFVDSELGMIPEGWNIQPISNIFNFQEGPGIRNWQYVNNGTKFINIRCINNDIINIQNANMISDEEAQGKYAHFMLKENDIVISCSGTLGRKALVLKEYLPLCLNTSVIRFTPRIKRQLGFLYGYLSSSLFLNKQIELASGSVQANFGPLHLKGMSIAIPDNNVLNQFSDIVNSIIQKKKNIISESLRLTNLRDSILPKLMSGEIKINS